MEKVLTENQMLLTEYLAAVGCETLAVMVIVTRVWEEDATLEMLQYCKDHPNADQAELLKASSKISSKYPWSEDEEE